MIRPDRLLLAAAALFALGNVPAMAQHEHAEGHAAEHGGTVAEAGRHHFEVVFEPTGLRVYPLGEGMTPGVIAGLKARAYFLMPGAKAYTDPYPLRPVAAEPGGPAEALAASVDLSAVPTDGTRVTVQVWSLPDPAEKKAEFTVPFAIGGTDALTVAPATEADKLGVAAQGTCPISGGDLNSMGGPIKVTRGEQSVYLCCEGCLPKVEAAPDQVFHSVISASKATEADADAVAAQGTCPITGKDLNAMGGPVELRRGDQAVFVCCPGCIDKVKADPEAYLGAAPAADDQPQG